ncbi:hypothetical protein NC653_018908 [Populus alba x Populus x berolinensis]|uniref:Aconitate hydratase n=1 Tax=Populus alba x Populus x berolinensis TaxID=444605 RepID=A0AAD6QHI2_9ROSI|nr:hypothetical protein NC653_018908 [Populus alba x Populus x berolinensis]
MANENPFKSILKTLEKPGCEFGKYYSLPALNDPRIGEGMSELSLADRATIANMSPEYGATMGFFPVDLVTLQYLKLTGRSDGTVSMIESYLRANKMFVDYSEPQIERLYSSYIALNLGDVEPCISGPKRPHDRVPLREMKADWHACLDNKVGFKTSFSWRLLGRSSKERWQKTKLRKLCNFGSSQRRMGFAIPKESQSKVAEFNFHGTPAQLRHGNVVIAAITSCTNTSNPSVMLGSALVAKKACELGLELSYPDYNNIQLNKRLQLQDQMGIVIPRVKYNNIDKPNTDECDLTNNIGVASLVYFFVMFSRVKFVNVINSDLFCSWDSKSFRMLDSNVKPWVKTSLAPGFWGCNQIHGKEKYLNQLGFHIVGYGCTTCIGNSGDIDEAVASAITENDLVAAVLSGNRNFEGRVHPLTRANYLASPPLVVAYALAGTTHYFTCIVSLPCGYLIPFLVDLRTLDNVSHEGTILQVDIDFKTEPIGVGKDGKNIFFRDIWPSNDKVGQVVHSSVLPDMFNATYQAITKGNPMWNQLSIPSGTLYDWDPKSTYIHEPPYFKSMTMYKSEGHDTVILAGAEYGSGSSRDWAAKGPMLLGVKAVIAKSFERIHRCNLVGMGIIPLCFKSGEDAETLSLTGHERYSLDLPSNVSEIRPGQDVTVVTDNGKQFTCTLRFDTEVGGDDGNSTWLFMNALIPWYASAPKFSHLRAGGTGLL